MRDVFKAALALLIVLLAVVICNMFALLVSSIRNLLLVASIPTPTLFSFEGSATLIPVNGATPSPTPGTSLIGESWLADGLALTVSQAYVSGCFIIRDGSDVCPPEGASYLWVRVHRENTLAPSDSPIYSCFWFTLHYLGSDLPPDSYAEGAEPADWSGGGCGQLYGGHGDEGWVYFEVPVDVDMGQAFLHVESYQGPPFDRIWALRGSD